MLVEDEDLVRELLVEELQRQGHQVAQARDQAGALASDFAPELLIVDVKLPDGSGIELLQGLRHRYPGLRVLLMSGYDRDQLPAAEHFLPKPFRIAQFREAVLLAAG